MNTDTLATALLLVAIAAIAAGLAEIGRHRRYVDHNDKVRTLATVRFLQTWATGLGAVAVAVLAAGLIAAGRG